MESHHTLCVQFLLPAVSLHKDKWMLMFVSPKAILASGYYAAFRVTLVAKALEGMYDGAIHITTDYEVGRC